jgi:dUTP pyrophosphatase
MRSLCTRNWNARHDVAPEFRRIRNPKQAAAMKRPCPVRIRYQSAQARALYEAGGGPAYATACSVGLDLRACIDEPEIVIPAGARAKVPSGIAIAPNMPDVAGFVYSRSGLGAAQGLTVAQGVGIIDPDYRGEILVFLLNTSGGERRLRQGERMAQLVFQPFVRTEPEIVEALDDTGRGSGGFGHTGCM